MHSFVSAISSVIEQKEVHILSRFIDHTCQDDDGRCYEETLVTEFSKAYYGKSVEITKKQIFFNDFFFTPSVEVLGGA